VPQENPLAGYTPGWRKEKDPLADYTPEWRVGTLGVDEPTPINLGQVVAGAGEGGMSAFEAVNRLAGWGARGLQKLMPWRQITPEGPSDFEKGAEYWQEEQEKFGRLTAPETGGDVAARLGGRLGFELGQYAVPGMRERRLVGAAAEAAAARSAGRGVLRGAGRDVAMMAPVDVLVTAGGPEQSVAGAVAELTDSELAERIAENPALRAGSEIAFGGVADVALRGLGAGIRHLRGAPDVAEGAAREVVDIGPTRGEVQAEREAVAPETFRTEPELLDELRAVDDEIRQLDVGAEEETWERLVARRDEVLERIGVSRGQAAEAGITQPAVVRAIAGGGIGAGVGAAISPEDKRLTGAATFGLVGTGLAGLRRGKAKIKHPYLETEAVQRVLGTVGEEAGVLGRVSGRVREVAEKAYTRIVDEAYPIRQLGRELEGGERLSQEASRAKGYRGAAQQRLNSDFRDVVKASTGHEEGVVALAKAERALELLEAGLEKTDIPEETLRQTVEELSAIPEVRRGVDALRGYYRSLLDHKLANGVIDQAGYDAITASGEYYIPFVRDFGEDVLGGMGGEGRLLSQRTGIRRMGKEKAKAATVDPFEQAILDTFEAERRVAKQRVTNIVSEIVERDPEAAAPFLREVSDPSQAKRGRSVYANVAGTRKYYEVLDPELYDAWASFEPYTGNIFVRLLSRPKTWLREGVTAMPDFGIANAIRDNSMAALQYPVSTKALVGGGGVGAVTGALVGEDKLKGAVTGGLIGMGAGQLTRNLTRTLDAMRDITGKFGGNPDIYKEWMAEGGTGFGFYVRNTKDAKRLLAELKKTGVSADDIVSPRSWWGVLQTFNRAIEEAPRLARYKYLRDEGVDVAESIYGARDLSLDFAKIGKHTKGVSAMTAFFNAQVQGWDKLVRLLKEPKTWGIGAAMITAPSLALWTVNKDNPEYWDRPQWERNLFWLVPKAGGGFLRIPKPFEVGFIFASVPERIMDYAYSKDPEALRYALTDIVSTYGPGASLPIPTAVEPLIENVADYSFFRNRPIDPHQYTNLPPEMQYTERTPTVAVGAGQLLGRSPAKIENLLRGYTGTLGSEVMGATSRLARRIGIDERVEPPEPRMPLVGRFLTRETQVSEREIGIRRRFNRAEETRNALKRLADQGETEKAKAYAAEHADELGQYLVLKELKDEIDRYSDARRMIADSREITSERKREAIAEINRSLARLLDAAMEPEGPVLMSRR
jgi:hypothetical protein